MAETAPAQAAVPVTGAPTTSAPTNGTTTVSANAHAEQTTANRGLPYYEKLRRDLRDTIHKKRLMDKSMVSFGGKKGISRRVYTCARKDQGDLCSVGSDAGFTFLDASVSVFRDMGIVSGRRINYTVLVAGELTPYLEPGSTRRPDFPI